jgi:subtilisin family serine protease
VPKFEFMPSKNSFPRFSKKRRPAGVSRSDKYRLLRMEILERREVMSANTMGTVVNYTAEDAAIRYQLLDNEVLNSFEKVSNLAQYTQAQLAAATQWVILADLGSNLADEIAAGGFKLDGATGIVPGALYVSPGSGGLQAMIDALGASADIDYFYPLVKHQLEQHSVTNDPYLQFQWHLINYGQLVGGADASFLRGVPGEDINIEGAWDFATGAGVQIGIVDTGVEMDHPDLADNVRTDLAVNLSGGGNNLVSGHGTAVAGLAAGVGNNGIGTTGVAYEADIVPIRLFSGDPEGSFVTDSSVAQSLIYQFQQVDIYNHSWGLVPENPRQMIDLGPLSLTALRNSVLFGRDRKGSIHVVAAGNDGTGTSAQYDGFNNSRYTISVTAVDHDGIGPNEDGTETIYPESGPNVLVSAPSGSVSLTVIRDTGLGSGIWTTDLVGNNGYNQGPDNNGLETDNDYFPDLDYASRFSSTSAAAPIVSGVIALMLDVNPNLTYRDVQHILVRASRQSNPDDASWQVNQREFQLDPLPPIDYGNGIFDPNSLWPLSPEYLVPQLEPHFENGAGFTVSQTFGSYRLGGYAHGMVDAAVAV